MRIRPHPKMSEREDNVYKAKLAEQAERYDGESYFRGEGDVKRPEKSRIDPPGRASDA